MTVEQLRSALVEAALNWQLTVDELRMGRGSDGEVNYAGIVLYKATKAYRAATR